MKTAIWLKIKDDYILYSVIWVNFLKKFTFYDIYEIQWKLTSNHACHKIVRKNTCVFYRKNKGIKRITLCVLWKSRSLIKDKRMFLYKDSKRFWMLIDMHGLVLLFKYLFWEILRLRSDRIDCMMLETPTKQGTSFILFFIANIIRT